MSQQSVSSCGLTLIDTPIACKVITALTAPPKAMPESKRRREPEAPLVINIHMQACSRIHPVDARSCNLLVVGCIQGLDSVACMYESARPGWFCRPNLPALGWGGWDFPSGRIRTNQMSCPYLPWPTDPHTPGISSCQRPAGTHVAVLCVSHGTASC